MGDQRLELVSATGLGPDAVTLRRLHGREALSSLYEYELELESVGEGGFAPEVIEDLLRAPCVIRFGEDGTTEVHGVIRGIRMLSTADGLTVAYRAHLVPKLWVLSQVTRSRVFQELDLPGLLRAVLKEMGLEEDEHFELRLSASYPVSEYTVQYQESDLAFISRICEHHGVFFFFDQLADGEKVVFGDDNRAFVEHEHFASLRYAPIDAVGIGNVHQLERTITPRPGKVLLRDYNWRTPGVVLAAEGAADERTPRGLTALYGEHFKTPGEGQRLARIRAEELLATRDLSEMETDVPGLAPGHKLELAGHPLGDLDRRYAVVSVEHSVEDRAATYVKRVVAIPLDVPFRPARTTAKPKILGVMHARIDGEVPGSAAPIDELGRYKVLFPFDLVGQPGGKASRWVRLAQPASGPGFGIHFPLHIGVEVIVAHLGGDPDRPVIVASPPNTETITPVNRDNATQSRIRTKSGILMTWDDDVAPASSED